MFLSYFLDNGIISVFDHMFCSGIAKNRQDVSPTGPIFIDIVKQYLILLLCPRLVFDNTVQMVLKTLSALFGCLEVLSPGLEIEVFCYFVPLSFLKMSK